MKMKFMRIAIALLPALVVVNAAAAQPDSKKLQVFILAGQSNMVGHSYYITVPHLLAAKEPEVRKLGELVFRKGSKISRADVEDLIATRMKRDELNKGLRKKEIEAAAEAAAKTEIKKLQEQVDAKMQNIKDTFVVSRQVYITAIADGNKGSGPLTVGYGGSPDKIGPEFGFGLSMAEELDAPILIIKTSWGGKSLNYNFRPPSAGPYELNEKEKAGDKAEDIRKNASLNWRMMNEAVHAVLKDLKKHHPAYDPAVGHDMAGFVWFQGFNDQFSDAFRNNYRDNMVHFVKDVRKEYDAPKMPFVIGVLGTNMTKEGVDKNAVSVAQREAAAAPEFKGNVAAVESYKVYDLEARAVYDKGWSKHFAEWCVVGSDRPYHYLGSGKFFVRLGDAFAKSMIDLMQQ
ncbi:MAG: sialate O-acetylesterase [Verrucomicrobiales bacterium]